MTGSLRTCRWLLGAAAALLAVTAALHVTGLSSVARRLAESDLHADWVAIFEGLWVMFSLHLLVMAAVLVALAARPASRLVLVAAAAMPLADTALLLTVVGPFVGPLLTGLAGGLCLVAAVAMPRAG